MLYAIKCFFIIDEMYKYRGFCTSSYLCIVILKLNIPSLVPFPGQNPDWFSLISASNFFSLQSRILLRRAFITWLMRQIDLKSEHSSVFGFFGIVMNTDCARSFGMYPVFYYNPYLCGPVTALFCHCIHNQMLFHNRWNI